MKSNSPERLTIKPQAEADRYRDLTHIHGSPLLLLDLQVLQAQHERLTNALPNVDMYYAVKSLPDKTVVSSLHKLGCGFDIATSGEADLLQDLGVSARRTIHTHPVKRQQDIRDALRYGCTTFVVDNVWELEKFLPYRHRIALLLRVSFPNPDSPVDLSRKFGCKPDEVLFLLQRAASMGLHVKGLSFHAGSQAGNSQNHVYAINECHRLIQEYTEFTGRLLPMLDIGGGFPVEYCDAVPDIDVFCKPIREALALLPEHVQVIAEPGRYLSAPSMTSVSTIMGKANRGDAIWYYLDDGLYGSYSGQLYDHAQYPLTVFSDYPDRENAVLAGPTCDSIDVIAEDIELPPLQIGDIIVGKQMGAYTSATATDFNSFPRAKIIVVDSLEVEQLKTGS